MGLKHTEDWIFNLNIGNVMYLAKMDEDELAYPIDRYHELNKDAMLEKIVLMWSWYFWVATELRLLSDNKEIESNCISHEHSDMWHAQSAYISSLFLPAECPLVDHLISSYDKYHISQRKELSELELKIDQNCSQIQDHSLFKKRKGSKASSRNKEILKKSKSTKMITLVDHKSEDMLFKKLKIDLSIIFAYCLYR